MMLPNETQVRQRKKDDDTEDPTAPFYELESFDSVWQGLRWKEIRTRVPVCLSKTIRSRYMLANLVYLGYAIGILIIDFNSSVNGSSNDVTTAISDNMTTTTTTTTPISILGAPIMGVPLVNRLYIEAGLYLWSAIWYPREDTLGGYYTLAIHKIEMTAATVELLASFGWIITWYLSYVRTLGRGFSLDDPDTIAYLTTTVASIMYFVYNIQINIQPEQYGTNFLYTYADILYFIGACYYIFAALRDDHWFWFLPMAGQYGIAPGKIQIDAEKMLPTYGKPAILITDLCNCCRTKNPATKKNAKDELNMNNMITITLH